MITSEQSEKLESLQRKAMCIIYGFDKSQSELLSLSGNAALKERREAAAISFANKLVASERFGVLFPTTGNEGMSTRNKKKYVEEKARTSRLYNSPLFITEDCLTNNLLKIETKKMITF